MVGDNPGVGATVGVILRNGAPVDAGVGVGIGGSVESGAPRVLGVDTVADVRAGAAAAYTGSGVRWVGVSVRVRIGRAVRVMVGVGTVVRAVVWCAGDGGVGVRVNVGMVVGAMVGLGIVVRAVVWCAGDGGVGVRVNAGMVVGAMVGVGIVVRAVVWSDGGVGVRVRIGRVVGVTGGVSLGRSSGDLTPCQRRVATSRIDTVVPTADVVKLGPTGRPMTCVGAEGQNWVSSRGHSTTTTPMVVSLPSSTRDSM